MKQAWFHWISPDHIDTLLSDAAADSLPVCTTVEADVQAPLLNHCVQHLRDQRVTCQ
jgi:hypothetical protein